jgi:hypothetical protein
MMDSEDVTITIPGHLKGWVLDGVSHLLDGLANDLHDMEDFPEDYSAADREKAVARVVELQKLNESIRGR